MIEGWPEPEPTAAPAAIAMPEPEPEPEPGPPSDAIAATVRSLVSKLGSKRSFVRAVRELREAVLLSGAYERATAAEQSEVYSAVKRVVALLRSRYTSPQYWRAGTELFLSCVCFMEEPDRQSSLAEWVIEAESQLQEGELRELREEARERAEAARAPGGGGGRRQAGRASAVAEPLGEAAAAASASPAGPSHAAFFGHLPPAAAAAGAGEGEELEAMLAQLLSGGAGGRGADGQGLEEVLAGLGIDVAAAAEGAPPASRDARAALRLVTITTPGEVCAVCTEEFELRAKAKRLPCGHTFHEACVLEWLECVRRFSIHTARFDWLFASTLHLFWSSN
jgi:hypothetical protein